MMPRRIAASAMFAVIMATFSAGAQAQDASELTADQLNELFQTQKTRGLVIAPAAGAAETVDEAATAATATEAAPASQTYVQLDRADQVNIQISFDFDSAALRQTEKVKLVALCDAIRESDIQLFRIVGHTDSAGAASYNERLSLLRAEEVKRHLTGECGIDETRLEAIGVGQSFPLDPDDTRSDVNRRVEFQVVS
jgi:OmpA-OmpF porin, OOP family